MTKKEESALEQRLVKLLAILDTVLQEKPVQPTAQGEYKPLFDKQAGVWEWGYDTVARKSGKG